MAVCAVNINIIKEKFTREVLHNVHSRCSREALHIVTVRKSDGRHFHHSRDQIDCEMLTSQEISNLFTVKRRQKQVKRILFEGAPGVGKTTLSLFLLEDWVNGRAFQQFELVLFFPLRQMKSCSVSNQLKEALAQVLSEESVCMSLSHYLTKIDRGNVLIIADGWNELDEAERHSGALLYEVLFGDLLNHLSVIVTSRPSASKSLGVPWKAVDSFMIVHGFSKEGIEKYILSEFTDDSEKAHCFLEVMSRNQALQSMCTVPMNCAIACHLYRSIGMNKLQVTTMTELYKEYILNMLALLCDDNPFILTFDTLPFDMQKLWWNLCEIAFSTIKKSSLVFSQEELVDNYSLLLNEAILGFNLLQSLECSKKTKCFQFLHVTFQEFLAALFIANKMSATQQHEVYSLYGHSSRFGLVWRFFFGLCSPKSLDAIKSKILSTGIPALDLCHLAFEIKDDHEAFSSQLVKKICKNPTLIATTAYDYAAVVHTIGHIQNCSDISLNVSNCVFAQTNLSMLADALADKCEKFQLKNLILSGNKLSDNDVAHFFSKVANVLQPIEMLNLHDNEIGENGMKSITKALTKLRSLQLSHNPLGVSGIHALESAIMSGTLSDIQEFKLQGSFTKDKNTNDELLQNILKAISVYCDELQLFDISENCIGKQGAIALVKCLSQKSLQLQVNKTTLDNEGFEAFFNTCEGMCSFESLEMKDNGINSKGVQCLVDKVSSGMLLQGEIHLDENPLGMEAVLSIGQLLSSTYCLISTLSLTNCHLNKNIGLNVSNTAKDLQKQLFELSRNNGLHQLELDCNNFTEDGIQILTGFMYLCPYLRFLSSSCCQLTSDDLNALLTRLSKKNICNELTTWCLEDCNIDDKGVKHLIKYVPLIFPDLIDIHLHGNPVSASMRSKLKEMLHSMKFDHVIEVEADGNQPQSIQLQG